MAFFKDKHIRFWRMNASLLPHHYMSNDSSRMTLGYFIVAALDLLGALETVDKDEKQGWIDWIYSCQCPEGGFRGFTGSDLGERRCKENRGWDPANVPATFFALAALLVLGDDLERVHRRQCLTWLPKMQRNDGSFGEVLGPDGSIEGGRDLRFCCCAAGIAYILNGANDDTPVTIDVEALTQYIDKCQSYDGGFGEAPCTEPHSGLTYCAIAALALVHSLGSGSDNNAPVFTTTQEAAIHWMAERQTDVLEEDAEDTSDEEDEEASGVNQTQQGLRRDSDNDDITGQMIETPIVAGFNGRNGKIADTCYCFWNLGALAIMGRNGEIDAEAMRRYLLDKTQHMIGGFGKGIGAPPDVMHSYLGLAALSLTGEEGIKPVDPRLCISEEAVKNLQKVSWKRL